MMLKVTELNTFYGPIHAVKDISMEVEKGDIVTLIGSNGAGKSTLLNTIIGNVKAKSGKVELNGKDITNTAPYALNKLGIAISPEGREVFPGLTVSDNLRIGAYSVKNKQDILKSYDRVYEIFPKLKEREKQTAGTLSGGEQQMLAIGRALMCAPQLLLLDEPSLGLAPNLVLQIFDLIKTINKQGVTILLVEQNANMALSIAEKAYVLENGRVSMSGEASVIAADPKVKKAYLGIG